MADNIILKVKVTPNAKKSEIQGWYNGALKIKLNAIAEDGKANRELLSLMKNIGVRAEILRGLTSREKDLQINNMNQQELTLALNKALGVLL